MEGRDDVHQQEVVMLASLEVGGGSPACTRAPRGSREHAAPTRHPANLGGVWVAAFLAGAVVLKLWHATSFPGRGA